LLLRKSSGLAIVVLVALLASCGHKANQSGAENRVGAQGIAPLSPSPQTQDGQPSAPTTDPQFAALKKYAASLPPVSGQTVEGVRFGEPQPDGTYLRDGRKMTHGEILASATPVACLPLTQIRLPDDWNKPAASAADKPASTGKTTSGLSEIFNPPQIPQVPQIGPPGAWNFGPIIGNPGPVSPPIFGGPPPPGHIPYEGEGIGPMYDPNPIIYNVMDGPLVDVAILHMGPYGVYGALAVLTKHTIQLFAGPNALGGMGSWTARLTINLPTQATTWDPDPAYRHTVDGAYAVRLRVADMNDDGRDDMVVVMNWDDPAWPQGTNQFGYNGTWIYYQNWSGYFDEPFSPGGASREYDIAAFNAPPTYGRKNLLPDLLGVQNPHIPSNAIDPGTGKPYEWDSYPTEYYDHSKFKDAKPTADPTPARGLEPMGSSPEPYKQWNWSIERTVADTEDTFDDLVTAARCYDAEDDFTYNLIQLGRGSPYERWAGGLSPGGIVTGAEPMRARPGRFELGETVDDYAVSFPSADSLLIAVPRTPVAPDTTPLAFYSPRLLLLPGRAMLEVRQPGEVQVSDLNGDGLSDLAVLSNERLYVLLNLGNRTFIVTDEFPVQDDVQRAFVGPLYSRTEKDIAVIDTASSQVLVYRPTMK